MSQQNKEIKRAPPRFPPLVWKVRERVDDGLPKTNNSVEGWHHAFQLSVNCHYPTVYKLIHHFRAEQENSKQCIQRFLVGKINQDKSEAKCVQLNKKLQALKPTYGNHSSFGIFKSCSN